jgi:hypothetical protein
MPADHGAIGWPSIRLLSTAALGPFSWHWPDAVESFDCGWAAVASLNGDEYHIRHGLGHRAVYGRPRLRSVTWVEGQPTVEGVEADDFEKSRSLLSLIKLTKRHLRPEDAIPQSYQGFTIVLMSEQASGAYSPRSLAVKLREDDIDGWAGTHCFERPRGADSVRRDGSTRSCHPRAPPAPLQ